MLARNTSSCTTAARVARQAARPTRVVPCRSLPSDAAKGFIDLSKLVTGGGGAKSPYDELSAEIGKQVYVDLAGWHLYTRDMSATPSMKMSQVLAMQLGPRAANRLRELDVEAVLKSIPVKAGAGKMTVSLYDVTPSMCVGDLTKILDDFGRRR